ncbi:MAG TPA: hypothetical protein VGP96_03440 [Candidatus Dormibacteraeota bacterium]|nr:hypothetical protein [Candidatus Dormibacteraeota bacterium]
MGRSARGRAAAALGVGAALLALTWRASPLPFPPMYEGLPGPAEPYRYLHPPPGLGSTPRPSTAHLTAPLKNGQSPALSPATAEMPPQAQLLAAQDAFVVPPGVTAVEATIAPVDPPPVAPIGGQVAGTVYDIEVTATGMPVAVRPGRTVTVVLRGPAGFGRPTIERFAAGAWSRLETQPLGALAGDSYAADTTGLGEFALVAAPGTSPGGGGGDAFVVILAAGAVLLTGGTLLALRRSRRPRAGGPPQRRPAAPPPRRRR